MHTYLENSPAHKGQSKKSNEYNSPVSQPSQVLVKAQLEMTTPGDFDELEADAVADSIVAEGKIARSVSTGHSGGGVALPSQFASQISSFQGQGSRIAGDLKTKMESGFGRDFSNVRLHTDNAAAEMSSSISAKAFTYGNDIFFNRGQYSPDTKDGQHLIAHELTHVAQRVGKVSREGDSEKDDKKNSDSFTTSSGTIISWDNIWGSYPVIKNNKQHEGKTNLQMSEAYPFFSNRNFSDLENSIVNYWYATIKNKYEPSEYVSERLAFIRKRINNESLVESLDSFITAFDYEDQFVDLHVQGGATDDPTAYIMNLARHFLMLGSSFFSKKKRNLDNFKNGCGLRLSLALAQAGVQIDSTIAQWGGGPNEYYGIDGNYALNGGPEFFGKALSRTKVSAKVIMNAANTKDGEKAADEYLKKELNRQAPGVKGIIVMDTDIWHGDAGGHVTLWNGSEASDDLDVRVLNGNEKQEYRLYSFQDIKWLSIEEYTKKKKEREKKNKQNK